MTTNPPTKPLKRWEKTAVVSFVLFLGLLCCMMIFPRPTWGTNVKALGRLDSRASNICFYRGSGCARLLVSEFNIKQADFFALAKEKDWHLSRIDASQHPMRFSDFIPEGHPDRTEPFKVEVKIGFIFEDRMRNGGGITVIYDSGNERAYVYQSAH